MSVSARFLNRKVAALMNAQMSHRHTITMKSLSRPSRGMQTQAQHSLSSSSSSCSSHQQREEFLRYVSKNDSLRNSMAYSLSHAASSSKDVNALTSNLFVNAPNERMQRQLLQSENQLRRKYTWDDAPLPRTLDEALRPSHRAIVITETQVPFRIVEVNSSWEGLCGYSFVECQGKTLGSLLQGPETDRSAVTAVVSQLLRGEEAGVVLTNYTKDGREFRNRLRVGPLTDGNRTTHFVGVLQEIEDYGTM